MKSFLRLSLTTIAATLFFSLVNISETKAQNFLPEILKRMDTNRQTLQTLRSSITMAKYNAQLGENDLTQGSVIYLPGKSEREMYIRIDWTKPVQEQLAVIRGEYTLYRPRLGQAIVGKVDSAKNSAGAGNALGFMSMSKEQLKANYNVKYLGEETVSGGTKTWHLELSPKAASKYKAAEIWVDGNGMPVQAKVIESNNDSTTVLLTNLQKNQTINAKVFTIDFPKKSTKIIKG